MITIGGWHISVYRFGEAVGGGTCYFALALTGVWLATMWWRDPKVTDARGSDEVARLGRRRNRIVKYAILAAALTWVLVAVLADMYAIRTASMPNS
ncbi:hypothetical protein ABH931_005650 [Streptacidiphilus sp. MAP12-33]|uniref:hypothetical protein n=1 Tax=Streptacidiphilus sp. MAP12-33 TaxID=3156266 RepID=UPI003512B945